MFKLFNVIWSESAVRQRSIEHYNMYVDIACTKGRVYLGGLIPVNGNVYNYLQSVYFMIYRNVYNSY